MNECVGNAHGTIAGHSHELMAFFVLLGSSSAAFRTDFAVTRDPPQVGNGASVRRLDLGSTNRSHNLKATSNEK